MSERITKQGDKVAVVSINGSLFLVTARDDGSIPLASRVLARLEECAPETADEIVRVMNSALGYGRPS